MEGGPRRRRGPQTMEKELLKRYCLITGLMALLAGCLVRARLQPVKPVLDSTKKECISQNVDNLFADSNGEICYAEFTGIGDIATILNHRSHTISNRSIVSLRAIPDVPSIPRLFSYSIYDKSEIFIITIDFFDHDEFASKFRKLQLLNYWNYQARVVVLYSDESIFNESSSGESIEERLFSVFASESFVNIFLVKLQLNLECSNCECVEMYTYNPYKNKENPTKPIEIKTEDVNLYDVSENLYGYCFRLAMVDIEPYIFTQKDIHGKILLQGHDGILVREVLKHMKATYTILRPDDNLPHGYFINKTINGHVQKVLNGAMGMVAYGEADMAANSWIMDPHWRFLVEYIYPHDQDNYCILVRKAKKLPFYRLLFLPFSKETWIFLGLSFLATSCFRVYFHQGIKRFSTVTAANNKNHQAEFGSTVPSWTEYSGINERNTTYSAIVTPRKDLAILLNNVEPNQQMDIGTAKMVHCVSATNRSSSSTIKTKASKNKRETISALNRRIRGLIDDTFFSLIHERIQELKQTQTYKYFHYFMNTINKILCKFFVQWPSSVFETFRVYLKGEFGFFPNAPSDRVLFGALGFASVTLTYSFQGAIISFLTTPVYQPEVEKLQEVDRMFSKIYTYPYFLRVFMDLDANDDVRNLKRKFEAALTVPEWNTALDRVRAGAAAALLTHTRASYFAGLTRDREDGVVRLARETALSPAHAHLALRTTSPLLKAFDRHFAHATQAGLTEHWRKETRRFFELKGILVIDHPEHAKPTKRKALRLEQVQAGFFALVAGIVIAGCVLTLEVVWKRIAKTGHLRSS